MSIPALRRSLRALLEPHYSADHPGLTLYRYHQEVDGGAEYQFRERTIANLAGKLPEHTIKLYTTAFARWEKLIQADTPWSVHRRLQAADRLFIGLGGASLLEFGLTLHHVYGLPSIPGSALKGVCSGYANAVWGQAEQGWLSGKPLHACLFGNPAQPDGGDPGSSGAVDFLDAWWIPENSSPFVPEIINPHHPNYYVADTPAAPSDADQPIPIKMLAVAGSFLFVVRGPAGWNDLAMDLLTETLTHWGVGGKTRAGYGRFKPFRGAGADGDTQRILWLKAHLMFEKSQKVIRAKYQVDGKTLEASTQDQELVPESKNRIFMKNKSVFADVEVTPLGGKNYRILKIRE